MTRWILGATLAGASALAIVAAGPARASVSLRVTWDALLHDSTAAVVVAPEEERGVWESGRIYTYSRLRVDRSVAGDSAAGADVWVRTMGGVVGTIGQRVEGEAVFTTGEASLVFLHPGPAGVYVVTSRGQGQFPVVPDANPKAPPHLVQSSAMGALVAPHPSPTSLHRRSPRT